MDRKRGIEMRGSVAALKVSLFEVTTLHNPFSCLGRDGVAFCTEGDRGEMEKGTPKKRRGVKDLH